MMHVPDVHEHDIDKAPPASPPPAEVAVRAADAAMPSVRLSYTPDKSDFEVLYATAATRMPGWQHAVSFVVFFALGGLLAWAGDTIPLVGAVLTWSKFSLTVVLILFISAGYAAVLGLRRLWRSARAARAAAAAGPIEFAAYDDFVSIAENGRTEVYPWREVLSATLDRGHVLLAVTGRRRIALPPRAFADAAAMNAFAAAAGDRVRLEGGREDAGKAAPATPETAR